MNILFLLTTALTVSIDSFVCGFSLSLKTQKKLLIACGIALTVLLMCLVTNYLGVFLQNLLTEKVANLGGLILIAVGIYNLFSAKEKKEETKHVNPIKQILAVGFAVGLDGAAANLSLSLMGYNAFYVPVVIAAMHFLTISLGILLSQTKIIGAVKKFDYAAPIILIALGCYKVVCAFI